MKRANRERNLFFIIVGAAVGLIIVFSVLFSTVWIDVDFNKKSNKIEETNEDKIKEKVDENTRKTIGKYSVVSGTRNGKNLHEDFVRVYDSSNNLVKEIKNVYTLIEVKVNDTVLYLGEISTDKGGANVSQIFDSDLNVIIDNSKLYSDGKEHWNTFTPFLNDYNNTIAVKTDNLYIFDLKGNVINTLILGNILGVYSNFYIYKDGTNINLANYDVQYVFTIANGNFDRVHHLQTTGNPINASWSEDRSYFSVVLYKDAGDIKHCTKFNYNIYTNEIYTEKYVGYDCIDY